MRDYQDPLRLRFTGDTLLPHDDEIPLVLEDLAVSPESAPIPASVVTAYRPAPVPAPRPRRPVTRRDLAAAAVGGLIVGLAVAVGHLMRWGRA